MMVEHLLWVFYHILSEWSKPWIGQTIESCIKLVWSHLHCIRFVLYLMLELINPYTNKKPDGKYAPELIECIIEWYQQQTSEGIETWDL